jgi:hypothetical protein
LLFSTAQEVLDLIEDEQLTMKIVTFQSILSASTQLYLFVKGMTTLGGKKSQVQAELTKLQVSTKIFLVLVESDEDLARWITELTLDLGIRRYKEDIDKIWSNLLDGFTCFLSDDKMVPKGEPLLMSLIIKRSYQHPIILRA